MESQRSLLVIGLLMVSFLLWQQWQLDYGPQPVAPATTTAEQNAVPEAIPSSTQSDDVPSATGSQALPVAQASAQGNLIEVTTDTLELLIDSRGGDVISIATFGDDRMYPNRIPVIEGLTLQGNCRHGQIGSVQSVDALLRRRAGMRRTPEKADLLDEGTI